MTHLVSINPFTLKQIGKYKKDADVSISKKINAAHLAQMQWMQSTLGQRKTVLKSIAKQLLLHKQALAAMATAEMGKPLAQSLMEVEKCAFVCNYYADRLPQFLSDITVESPAKHSYVSFQPLGVVLAVMPWNFPYWQVFRSLVPIIAGGNAYVLKHASNVSGCAKLILEVLQKSTMPKELFQLLYIGADKVAMCIKHPLIAAVTCTGSTAAGKAIATVAGAELKKCVLELGGSDASVILQDAVLTDAAKKVTYSRLINNGQSCIAAKRFIVTKNNHNKFVDLVSHELSIIKIGDPMDLATELGPLARQDLADELRAQVHKSAKLGAKVLQLNFTPDHPCFFAPTILTHVSPKMPAYHEEFFGPVCSIISAKNNAEAIQIANDTEFGLGAAVYGKNISNAEKIAKYSLHAGNCFVNDFVRSVPGMPFGGIKQSGYGRELGPWGMYEFMNIKTVYVG
jgi:succinate-semialdehyde dehydrogenase / glutarate-semialdehyde dehydrogenase